MQAHDWIDVVLSALTLIGSIASMLGAKRSRSHAAAAQNSREMAARSAASIPAPPMFPLDLTERPDDGD